MRKFLPGLWKYHVGSYGHIIYDSLNELIVADIYNMFSLELKLNVPKHRAEEIRDATARLIRASEEMYTMLEYCLDPKDYLDQERPKDVPKVQREVKRFLSGLKVTDDIGFPKFIPSPWRIIWEPHPLWCERWSNLCCFIFDESGDIRIADVSDYIHPYNQKLFSDEERKRFQMAHARLIAAAPEMYDLLGDISYKFTDEKRHEIRELLVRIDGEEALQ